MGMDLALPQSTASFRTLSFCGRIVSNPLAFTAEFRGPGIHHRYDDSPEDYEMDMDQRTRHITGLGGGRIILLGDGSDNFNDSADSDMFDQDEEDKDLESQINKSESDDADEERSKREETPAPSSAPINPPAQTESPSSTKTESSNHSTEINEKATGSSKDASKTEVSS